MNKIEQTKSLLNQYNSGHSINFKDLAVCIHEMSVNHIYDPSLSLAIEVLISNIQRINKQDYLWIEDMLNTLISISKHISELEFNDTDSYVITNAYYNESCSGVGDFIRGCCFLKRMFKDTNVKVQIDFENHYLGKYIKSSTPKFREDIFDTEKYNKDLCSPRTYFANMIINMKHAIKLLKENKSMNILTNFSDYVSLDPPLRSEYQLNDYEISFMRKNILFEKKVIDYVNNIGITDFTLVHFRLGDREMLGIDNLDENNQNTKNYNVNYEECVDKINTIAANTNNKIVVISDSNKFKKMLKNNEMITCPHLKSDHCSHNPGYIQDYNVNHQKKKEAMFYVAVDMYLSSIAQNIHSYSVYPWGSGFVFWISKIFNVPISTHIIRE